MTSLFKENGVVRRGFCDFTCKTPDKSDFATVSSTITSTTETTTTITTTRTSIRTTKTTTTERNVFSITVQNYQLYLTQVYVFILLGRNL